MNESINFLLQNACASIRYRLKKDLLKNILEEEKNKFQDEIIKDIYVKNFLDIQNEKGWIDEDFHSEKGVETAVRVFYEKGLDNSNEQFKKLMKEFEEREDFDNGCLKKVGKILDEKNLGGSKLIKAVIFSYAGIEKKDFVKIEINKILDKFQYVSEINNIDEIAVDYKGKKIFKDNIKWLSIYDLRLLAFTKSWRNEENYIKLVNGFKTLIKLSPIPYINVLEKNQLIAPASFCMDNFKLNIHSLKEREWLFWIHKMELLKEIGVIDKINLFKEQKDDLIKIMKKNEGLLMIKTNHYYFKKWGPYCGMALEKDWRSEKRRICDFTFRALKIIK
jgi:hypothetical protein